MKVNIYIPHPSLREFVINISTVQAVLPNGIDEVVNPYPPTPFQSLIFYCNDPVSMGDARGSNFQKQADVVLLGPQFSRVNIKVHRQLNAIRVDFYPGAMFRLLAMPMHEIFDGGFDAKDFFGAELRELNDQLQHLKDFDQGKNLVENFLVKKAGNLKELLPFDEAMKALLINHGNMAIDEVASISCLSLKQFERKCKERLGMNPKSYARILRFSKAYRLREAFPNFTWLAIAHAAGYFDQMHMIRDFKTFAGVNPSIIEQELADTPLRMQKDLPG